MTEPTWTERVEAARFRYTQRSEAVAWPLVEKCATAADEARAILDDPQRQEDEEAGRLLRELRARVGPLLSPRMNGDAWTAHNWRGYRDGPTPVDALRALRDAIGGEG